MCKLKSWWNLLKIPLILDSALLILAHISAENIPKPRSPMNLSLVHIFATAAVVQWDANGDDIISAFEMTVRPLSRPEARSYTHSTSSNDNSVGRHEIISDLDGSRRSFSLSNLTPATEYQLFLYAVNTGGKSNASDTITFRTLNGTDEKEVHKLVVNPGEIIVVVFVLAAWFCAIGLFLNKWGKIRISNPGVSRYKLLPKNIHTIKVVKKPTDSVIYKTHAKDSLYSKTMDARMKRLDRMNTMPNLKLMISNAKEKETKKDEFVLPAKRTLERNKSDPMIELDTAFNKDKGRRRKDLYQLPPSVLEGDELSAMGSVV